MSASHLSADLLWLSVIKLISKVERHLGEKFFGSIQQMSWRKYVSMSDCSKLVDLKLSCNLNLPIGCRNRLLVGNQPETTIGNNFVLMLE